MVVVSGKGEFRVVVHDSCPGTGRFPTSSAASFAEYRLFEVNLEPLQLNVRYVTNGLARVKNFNQE